MPTIVIGANPTAGSFSNTLLYNTGTGILSYDVDGSDAGAAVEIAQLSGRPALTAADFVLLG
jgi:hypothetical protein